MLEAVLPLRRHPEGRDDDLLRAEVLLRSLEAQWRDAAPLRLHVVSPEAECAGIAAVLDRPWRHLRPEFRAETASLPVLTGLPAQVGGWLRQQVIKLSAHRFVGAPFFLILDADLVALQPLGTATLVRDGRAAMDWIGRRSHPRWWDASATVLALPNDPAGRGMGVTPQIYSTPALRALEEALRERAGGGDPWRHLLLDTGGQFDAQGWNGWTENSLYTLFCESGGLFAQYHRSEREMKADGLRLGSPDSVWGAEGLGRWREEPVRPVPGGCFLVIQSSSGVAAGEVARRMAPLLSPWVA